MAATVNVKAGKLLFKEGDEGGGLYIIRRGRVQVFRERNDLEVQLAELGPGDVLGTMTSFDGFTELVGLQKHLADGTDGG